MLKPFTEGATAHELIDGVALDANLARVLTALEGLIRSALSLRPGMHVTVHGYDYAIPRRAGAISAVRWPKRISRSRSAGTSSRS